jgi:hypothetical protein
MTATGNTEPGVWNKAIHSPRQRLSLILWLVAVHSFCVGVGLIFLPDALLSVFGFTPGGERFFRAQAGVFHFVMVVVYAMAAVRFVSSPDSTYIAIAAKFIAMAFLFCYFLAVAPVWMVLLSGVVDGAFGALIAWAFRAYRRSIPAGAASSTG